MTVLKPFQKATVQALLAAFRKRRRARRFLVADEVGLTMPITAFYQTFKPAHPNLKF
jgi:hypothetical protein